MSRTVGLVDRVWAGGTTEADQVMATAPAQDVSARAAVKQIASTPGNCPRLLLGNA